MPAKLLNIFSYISSLVYGDGGTCAVPAELVGYRRHNDRYRTRQTHQRLQMVTKRQVPCYSMPAERKAGRQNSRVRPRQSTHCQTRPCGVEGCRLLISCGEC